MQASIKRITQTILTSNSTILAHRTYLSMKPGRNLHNSCVLLFGAPSQNQSMQDLLFSNLLQANSSYVVYDPDGSLYDRAGTYLQKCGYRVCRLDFHAPTNSTHTYNPFHYAPDRASQDAAREALLASGFQPRPQDDTLHLHQLAGTQTFALFLQSTSAAHSPLAALLLSQCLDMCLSSYRYFSRSVPHVRFLFHQCSDPSHLALLAGRTGQMQNRNVSYILAAGLPSQLSAFGSVAHRLCQDAATHVYFGDPERLIVSDAARCKLPRCSSGYLSSMHPSCCLIDIHEESPIYALPYQSKTHPALRRKRWI